MTLCNVCCKREAIGVYSSSTGAISFAYCAGCLKAGREPYGALVASLLGMLSMNEVAKWYHPTVMATLKAEGKTVEELFADVEAFSKEYEEAVANDHFD